MPVTYRAFLLRLRRLVEIALQAYGLEDLRPKFINYSGNGLYQVTVPSGGPVAPGKYLLRVHQPNYMKPEYIVSEMDWLAALREDGIPVPIPIHNLSNEWLTEADGGYDVPQARICTLVGWTEGRILGSRIRPMHFKSLGRIIGTLHEHAKNWKPPQGFARPHWDWEGLYGDGFSYGVPAADARNTIPKVHQNVFNETLDRVREVSEQFGKGKNVYGLIHADLGVAENVAYLAGEARPFDFDDCGFGYWLFDFGVPLSQHFMDTGNKSRIMQDALLSGYEETSDLDDIGIEYLNTFMAARIAQLIFFLQASGLANPHYMPEAKTEINNHAKYLRQILKRMK